MGTGSSVNWFLEIEGKKVGPYPLDQIQGLLEDGEIPADQRVTADHLNGQWVTVRELLERLREVEAAHARNAAYAVELTDTTRGGSALPPRPTEIASSTPPDMSRSGDPTLGLFDALQASRERKASRQSIHIVPLHAPEETSGWSLSKVPSQAWLVLSLTMVLGVLVWATISLLRPIPASIPQLTTFSSEQRKTPPPRVTTSKSTPRIPPPLSPMESSRFGGNRDLSVIAPRPPQPAATADARDAPFVDRDPIRPEVDANNQDPLAVPDPNTQTYPTADGTIHPDTIPENRVEDVPPTPPQD